MKNLLSSSLLPKTIKIKIQRTVILSNVVYEYDIWSLKLKEEHLLSVFQRKAPRRMFGRKREEVKWEWREIYNENMNDLYSSPNILRVM
jgi:hypothetical protein